MSRPCYVVDVFASEPFGGNPAAVVLDAHGLSDGQMQAVAAEFNLSETTFVLPPSGVSNAEEKESLGAIPDLRFRWFTPSSEVRMCGHATIAGVHVLAESGRLPMSGEPANATLKIETRSGTLTAFVEPVPGGSDRMIWLELIDPAFRKQEVLTEHLAAALGLTVDDFDASLPTTATQDDDLLAFVSTAQCLNDVRPDRAGLAALLDQHGLRGLCLATVDTVTPSISVQSRFFAPTVGVDEDPVTGSVHGPLAVFLVMRGRVPVHEHLAGLMCAQGIPGGRGGVVNALVQPKAAEAYSVRIGGRALTSMRGLILI